MTGLDDAWGWYRDAVHVLSLAQRMAERYWDSLPWEGPLGRDNQLGQLEASDMVEEAGRGLAPLDDLAVTVLFSVFEAAVRSQVASEVSHEGRAIRHVALRLALRETTERIEEGSFFWILESFKGLDARLVEEVNQVRRYRNWVAHGRRGKVREAVSPKAAYDRLRRFLEALERSTDPNDSFERWDHDGDRGPDSP